MEKKHFQHLVASIKEMKLIRQGKLKPARVTKVDPISIKAIRQKLHQSQSEFAYMIGVSPSTLRNWEQGLRHPDGPAIALLTVAQKNPKAVYEALYGKEFYIKTFDTRIAKDRLDDPTKEVLSASQMWEKVGERSKSLL